MKVVVLLCLLALFLSQCAVLEKKRIGVLRWVSNEEYDRNIDGFKDALSEKGFVEDVDIEYIIANAELNETTQRAMVEDILPRVEMVYSLATAGTLIVKEMVKNKPVVFSIITYPVESGIINSLNYSDSNLVGTRNYVPVEKQIEFILTIDPNVKKIGFVHRQGERNSEIQLKEFSANSKQKGIELVEIAPLRVSETEKAIENTIDKVDVLYIACDTLIETGGAEIAIKQGNLKRKPVFSCNKSGVRKGALAGIVVDFYTMGYLAGKKAAAILSGTPMKELRTETTTEYTIINVNTALYVNLTIPNQIMDRADEIVM